MVGGAEEDARLPRRAELLNEECRPYACLITFNVLGRKSGRYPAIPGPRPERARRTAPSREAPLPARPAASRPVSPSPRAGVRARDRAPRFPPETRAARPDRAP